MQEGMLRHSTCTLDAIDIPSDLVLLFWASNPARSDLLKVDYVNGWGLMGLCNRLQLGITSTEPEIAD
jgi:hypothetical protein